MRLQCAVGRGDIPQVVAAPVDRIGDAQRRVSEEREAAGHDLVGGAGDVGDARGPALAQERQRAREVVDAGEERGARPVPHRTRDVDQGAVLQLGMEAPHEGGVGRLAPIAPPGTLDPLGDALPHALPQLGGRPATELGRQLHDAHGQAAPGCGALRPCVAVARARAYSPISRSLSGVRSAVAPAAA